MTGTAMTGTAMTGTAMTGAGPAVAAAPGRTTGVAAVSGTPGTGTALDAGQAATGGPVMMVTTARHGGGAAGIRRLAPWIALLVIVVFLIPLAFVGLHTYHLIQAKDHPPDYVARAPARR